MDGGVFTVHTAENDGGVVGKIDCVIDGEGYVIGTEDIDGGVGGVAVEAEVVFDETVALRTDAGDEE